MMDLALLLLQEGPRAADAREVFRFFAAFVLIRHHHTTFLRFTYWIQQGRIESPDGATSRRLLTRTSMKQL